MLRDDMRAWLDALVLEARAIAEIQQLLEDTPPEQREQLAAALIREFRGGTL